MPTIDSYVKELGSIRSQAVNKIGQVEAEYNQLLQTDPIAAAKKAEEGRFLLTEYDSLMKEESKSRMKLKSMIADGSFLTPKRMVSKGSADDVFTSEKLLPMDEKQYISALNEGLSTLLGGEVDLDSGVDGETRFGLAFKTGENKEKYLQEKFGKENVQKVDIAGKTVTVLKDPTSNKYIAIDELGLSPKDLIDASGEVAPTIGSIIGGAVAIPTVGASTKSPLAVAAFSAGGYTAAASLQDQIASIVTGIGPTLLEAIPERATEAMVGLPIEYGTMKIGKGLGPSIATSRKGKVSERQKLLEESQNYLSKKGYDTFLADIASGGDQKTINRLRLAQRLPEYKIGRDVEVSLDRLKVLQDQNTPPSLKGQALYGDTIKMLQNEAESLNSVIGTYDKQAALQLKTKYNDDVYRLLSRPNQDKEGAGAYIFGELKSAEKKANDLKDEVYTGFYEMANQQGVQFDPVDVAKAIESEYFKGLPRNAALEVELENLYQRPKNAEKIKKIDKQLESSNLTEDKKEKLIRERGRLEALSGPLMPKQMDDLVAIFREAVPEGGTVGKTRKEIASGKASKTISEIRNEAYSSAGLMDEWNYARDVLQQRLGFEEQQIGTLLKETLGRSDKTGRGIVESVLSEPRVARDVLNVFALNGEGPAYQGAMSLQQDYLQKIGFGSDIKGRAKDFNFDPDMVRTLFSFSPDGKPNGVYGERMVRNLENLKKQIEFENLDASKITADEIYELGSALSEDSKKRVLDTIVKRNKAAQDLDLKRNDILLKIAGNGHREAIDRHEFPQALWTAPSEVIKKTLGKFGPKDQKMIRDDYAEYFFTQYPPKDGYGRKNVQLFDGPKFLSDIKKQPKIEENLRAVVGDEFVDDMINAANVADVITRVAPEKRGLKGGAAISAGGVRPWISIETITGPAKARIAAAMYRSKQLHPLLRNLGKKELSPEDWDNAVNTSLKTTLGSSIGIQALLQTGKYDPLWAAELGNVLGTTPSERLKYEREQSEQMKIPK
jgi:hypothetical protein